MIIIIITCLLHTLPQVHRRFRDFFFLDRQLRKYFNRVALPQLPPRRFLKNEKTPGFVEERKDLLEAYLRRLVKIQPIWGRNDIVLFLDSEVSHMPATFQLSYSSSNGRSTAAQPRASLSTIFRSPSIDTGNSNSSAQQARRSMPIAATKRRSILGMFGGGNRTSSGQEDSGKAMEIELHGSSSDGFPSEVDSSPNEPPVESPPAPTTVTRRSSVKKDEAPATDESGGESVSNIGKDNMAANLTDSQSSTLYIVGIYLVLFVMTLALLDDLIKFVLHPFK